MLLTKCQQYTGFLSHFVGVFESMITKPICGLSFGERHLLIKFCYDFGVMS